MPPLRHLPAKDAIESLIRDGAYIIDDEVVGAQIYEFHEGEFPTNTPSGFEFLAQNSLERKDVKEVCESILGKPQWGFIKIYGSKLPEGYVYRFHPGSLEKINTVTILLWSPDSELVLWKGSTEIGIETNDETRAMLHGSPTTRIKTDDDEKAVSRNWGLLAAKESRFREVGISGSVVALKSGGLALSDCRLGFQIRRGYAIFIGFTTESQLRSWGKMKIPYSDALNVKIEELRRRGFNINYTWTY